MADWWDAADTWLAEIRSGQVNTGIYNQEAWFYVSVAESEFWFGSDHNAIDNLITACYKLTDAISGLNPYAEDPGPTHYEADFLEKYCLTTWESIVSAWVRDDFAGRAWTIAVIDKMRQLIWDEPFDITWSSTIGQAGGP